MPFCKGGGFNCWSAQERRPVESHVGTWRHRLRRRYGYMLVGWQWRTDPGTQPKMVTQQSQLVAKQW